jgi:hypothetical protein
MAGIIHFYHTGGVGASTLVRLDFNGARINISARLKTAQRARFQSVDFAILTFWA